MQKLLKRFVLICSFLAAHEIKVQAALTSVDIGNPAIPGSITVAGNGYDITAAGTNIIATADQFTFAYEQLAGDFDLKTRLEALSPTSPWAKAGLMARETLASNSRFAASLAGPNIAGAFFESRAAVVSNAVVAGSYPVNYPDTWLRLQRVGTTLNGFASSDGQNWIRLGSLVLATNPPSLYVGIAACSAEAAQTATVAARDYGTAAGGVITPLVLTREALGPSTRRTGLVISEIMYHPKSRADGKTLEFIELYNSMSIFEDVSGYKISGDVSYTIPPGTVMQPGTFLVLAKIKADVQAVYGLSGALEYGVTNGFNTNVVGNVTNITPNVENSLNNAGGNVRLHGRAGQVLLDATFSTTYPWPIEADGGGHSLVLARPSYGEGHRQAWAASDVVGGSPGTFDSIGFEPARNVVINEFLAHTDPPQEDMIELYNHGATPVDISGFWLSDTVSTNKFRIPDSTVLPARGFISFTAIAAPITPVNTGFALGSSGEQIVLVNSNQTRVIDAIEFEGQENGVSMGRFPDGAPTFTRLSTVTAGASNTAPRASPIVISEIMYNPISGDSDDEFIELYNRGASAVNVGNWTFSDGIDFNFPPNTIMPPGAYLVVARNAARLQANYDNLDASNLVGNYGGNLGNGGERVALAAPDYEITTNASGQIITNVAFHFVVNEVTYGTEGRWGDWADGGGSSLELIDARSDNALAANWADSDESSKGPWTSFENRGPSIPPGDSTLGSPINDRIQVFMLGVGECMVDEVEVRNSNNQNLVSNGSFESGLTGWTLQGSHDQSFIDNAGFVGRALHILAQSRGDNGANRIYAPLNPTLTTTSATLRAKARWLRGFPEVLLRMHGGTLEAFGRLPVPSNLGSPGAPNSRALTNAGPAVYDVGHAPALPQANESVRVTARVNDPNGISRLVVRYRVDPAAALTPITMVDDGTAGDEVAGDGLFTATISGRAAATLIAFHIEAVDGTGVTNLFPRNALRKAFPNDAPTHECLVRWGDPQMPGSFATYHLWITEGVNQRWTSRLRLNNSPLDGTFVYNNQRVVYNMKPQYAGSPWHRGQMNGPLNPSFRLDYVLQFPDDDLMLGANDFVINTPGNPDGNNSSDTSAMAEQTSYEIFKGINVHYNYRRYVHMFVNGQQRSVAANFPGRNYIMEDSQQPNGDVIDEWWPDDTEGQLYKIEDWFEFPDNGLDFTGNNDADLTRRITTYNGVTNLNLAPYRFMWRKRSVGAGDSANDYTNFFAMVDIVSPASNPNLSPLSDALVKQFAQVADFEQWMRIFAVQHTVGNWDAYGYNRGKNAYTYRPARGRFAQMTWDIDFTMGIGGDPATTDLFGTTDPRLSAMFQTPEIVRAYWRAYKDIIHGPLTNAYLYPLLDARAAAFAANNVAFTPAQVTTIKNFIRDRRNYISNRLNSVNATFNVANTNFTSTSNIVTITGTAPIDVKYMELDGVTYPITWTSPTAWSLRVPMNATGSNGFTLRVFDRVTNEIPSYSRTIAVNFTGTVEGPQTNIIFNEIMYNALVAGAEYVELFNRSATFTFDLTGWRINGLDYTFPEGATIGPRGFLVLTKDRVAFANAYGGSVPVFDQFAGDLQTGGETLTLIRPGATPAQDLVVDQVRYDSALPWPTAANGTGSALQLVDPSQDNSRVGNWFSTYVPAVYSEAMGTPSRTNDGWQFVKATGSVGPGIGGGQMRLIMFLGTELGSAIIDEVSLVPGTNAAVGTTNYIRNGGFETLPLLDDPQLTNSWTIGTNYTNTAIISSLTHSGNGALRIEASTFGSTFPRLISQNLSPAPPPNSTNTLSFWYWATNSSTNLSIRLFNSAAVSTLNNINVSFTPSNYVPPMIITAATNTLTPARTNQNLASLPPFPTLWINELQSDNINGIVDSAGQRDPWIELYNSGAAAVSLDGLYLSSNYTNLTSWAFPAGRSIAPGQFLVIFCDGQSAQTTATELHTSFHLTSGSGSVALSRLYNGAPQVLDYVDYAELSGDRSYGSFPNGQLFDRQEFYYVTPGASNDGRSAPLNVFINEWMAVNQSYLSDPADFNYDDWFELYNPGTNAVDIAGYYLTDVLTNKFKYQIPTDAAHVIPPRGFLLVWADNESGQNSSGGVPRSDLHVNFALSAGGEAIGLFAADGTQIDAVTFGPQATNVTEGRFPNGGPIVYTMTNPTPRVSNFIPGLGNNPPVLGAIGSKSVYVSQTLAFTATVTDPDPGQLLNFTLDGGAPPGATIGVASGAFSWTPTEPGTNVITVRVTDNGAPALDDYENIVVRVLGQPDFATPSINGNDLTLTWGTTPGRIYRVEYKSNLNDANWTPIGQDLTANSDSLSITDDITGAPQRFYRLVVVE